MGKRLSVLVAALVLGFGLAGTAHAAAVRYVALGDSYSAGVGAGDYLPDSGSCQRSDVAYPRLWANAHAPASFQFVACSGATTSDVLDNQLSALSPDTTLVSITIGGNDAGFVPTMERCVTGGTDGCAAATQQAIDYIQNTLPARLDSTYTAIHAAAPNATVVVLGYPRLYQLDGSCKVGLSDTARGDINHAADVLDETIADRASADGAVFADVRPAFDPHRICTDDWWLHSTTWPVEESYHPNREGQADGYLPVFAQAATGTEAGTATRLDAEVSKR